MPTSWMENIEAILKQNNLSIKDIEYCIPAITSPEMNEKFDHSYGATHGCAFTCWTKDFVLVPATYDGAEWVQAIPRNPCDLATSHIGGG